MLDGCGSVVLGRIIDGTCAGRAPRHRRAGCAGADPRRIHHLERDAEFLIELPDGVQVLEIVAMHGRTGAGA